MQGRGRRRRRCHTRTSPSSSSPRGSGRRRRPERFPLHSPASNYRRLSLQISKPEDYLEFYAAMVRQQLDLTGLTQVEVMNDINLAQVENSL